MDAQRYDRALLRLCCEGYQARVIRLQIRKKCTPYGAYRAVHAGKMPDGGIQVVSCNCASAYATAFNKNEGGTSMKHLFILVAAWLVGASVTFGNTLTVGTGQTYTLIQSAINAASTGDTIKVLPGTYNEAIIINKNIVIQGSGYETTRITSANNPTIAMSAGKMMWFSITSTAGDGAQISAGLITNCVVAGCGRYGIVFTSSSTGSIKNCVLVGNARSGAKSMDLSNGNGAQTGTAVNCIAWSNGTSSDYGYANLAGVTYCDGSTGAVSGVSNVIDVDPKFTSGNDFHIPPTSPCYQTGNPADVNPDGSRSDMGYFGGSDCPIYPVVTKIVIVPSGNGQVQIQATAQANY